MLFLRLLKELPETFGLLAKSILKKLCAVSNSYRIVLIFDKTILPAIKDCKRDKRCQNESWHIKYQITGPQEKRPNNFQDALLNVYLKKALVKFITSTWGEEKDVTILQNKELRLNCEYTCFLYRVEKGKMTKTVDKRLCCNHEEADTKILFYVGHLVAPNNVVVRTADTDFLIIALENMKKLPAGINVWLEMGLHTNNTLRYVKKNKLHQELGNSFCVALPGFHAFTGSDYTALFNRKGKIRPLKLLERSENTQKVFLFWKDNCLVREKFKLLLKPSRNLLVQRMAEKNLLQLTKRGWTFS